jgi:hypothetical protein
MSSTLGESEQTDAQTINVHGNGERKAAHL